MGWFSGTSDKPIYADVEKTLGGVSGAVDEQGAFLSRLLNDWIGATNAPNSGAGVFQGKSPIVGQQGMYKIWEEMLGNQARLNNPIMIKEGTPGFLGSLLSAAGSQVSNMFGGGSGGSYGTGTGGAVSGGTSNTSRILPV